jgi:tyrosyl-tRNA synthetase
MVHGEAEVIRAEEAAAALFSEEIAGLSEETLLDITRDAPSSEVPRTEVTAGLALVDALVRAGLVSSKGEARRTIEQGGAYVNNVRQSEVARNLESTDLLHDRYLVLRKGQRAQHVLRVV